MAGGLASIAPRLLSRAPCLSHFVHRHNGIEQVIQISKFGVSALQLRRRLVLVVFHPRLLRSINVLHDSSTLTSFPMLMWSTLRIQRNLEAAMANP